MNNKGITLIELITTFALSAVIIILLLNVIVVIRNLYSNSSIKTELYINQSNLSNQLNQKINNNNLYNYDDCSDSSKPFCYNFILSNDENIELNITNTKIQFGDYVYKLNDSITVENPSIDLEHDNKFLVLKIPIKHKQYPNMDFGINLVYLYNAN